MKTKNNLEITMLKCLKCERITKHKLEKKVKDTNETTYICFKCNNPTALTYNHENGWKYAK